MKNYNGILILEPEDTFINCPTFEASALSIGIRGGNRPLYEANMVIAKRSDMLFCLKSRERDSNSYSQAELQEIVDRCENPIDINLLLML